MNRPKGQHLIPAFYLRRFCGIGSQSGRLDVYDAARGKFLPKMKPRNVAVHSDFYTAENLTGDPYLAERGLADLESRVAPTIAAIDSTHSLPTGDAWDDLLYFFALLFTRTEFFRAKISDFVDQVSQHELLAALSSPEAFETLKKKASAQGKELSSVDREELIELVRSGSFRIDFDRPWHVGMMFDAARTLHQLLIARRWQLVHVVEGQSKFVTNDKPVLLDWGIANHPPLPPGFGLTGTICHIPLSKDSLLIGVQHEDWGDDWFEYRPTIPFEIMSLNGYIISRSRGQVFASPEPFAWVSATFPGEVLDNDALSRWVETRADSNGTSAAVQSD